MESRFEFEFIYIEPKEGYDYVEDDNKLVKFSDKRHGECEKGIKEILLEDDFIFSAFKTRIRFCLGKGEGLWLVVRPSISSFRITHSTFILALCFCISLIQPSTSNISTCECGHRLDAFGTHLARCLFGVQRIATHDVI